MGQAFKCDRCRRLCDGESPQSYWATEIEGFQLHIRWGYFKPADLCQPCQAALLKLAVPEALAALEPPSD